MYMNWPERCEETMPNNQILPLFTHILRQKKEEWQKDKRCKNHSKQDLEEIAMHPTRVQDWYMDWEMRKEVEMFFHNKTTIQ